LQIFNLEVTLICDQGWINVGAYGPKKIRSMLYELQVYDAKSNAFERIFNIKLCYIFETI